MTGPDWVGVAIQAVAMIVAVYLAWFGTRHR